MQMDRHPTLESTFGTEFCFIISKFLSLHDIFCHFALLNKQFKSVIDQTKSFSSLWKYHFLKEFVSSSTTITDEADIMNSIFDAFIIRFREIDVSNGIHIFTLLVNSIKKQK